MEGKGAQVNGVVLIVDLVRTFVVVPVRVDAHLCRRVELRGGIAFLYFGNGAFSSNR